MNIAIVLAAGQSQRYEFNNNKLLEVINSRPVVGYSLDVLNASEVIDEIVLVTRQDLLGPMQEFVDTLDKKKNISIIIGGRTRIESTLKAIEFLKNRDLNPNTKIIIHDASRPFVESVLLNEVLTQLDSFDAVSPVLEQTETLVETSADEQFAQSFPNRKRHKRTFTPQGFRLSTLFEVFEAGVDFNDSSLTNECVLISRYLPGRIIKLVSWESAGVKITFQHDLDYAAFLFSRQKVR
jgi:2-C-methyl-D-erythritol 4-phosphate cytidylyltransferase